ncbi:unnamed protein product [Rotaria sordida]|uniref:Transposase n=2 Tax=Rotaria sordida TaxID=392033 RepID=A0A815PC02_9BILA|nr:unnamed protein product [Rotaria sordida]CAF1447161.1 unnamed protein product [Rotaria sordida]CAF1631897.1 unnamed protein product [Rotaria sordida]
MLGQKNNLKKIDIVKHFVLEGYKRSTVYDAIKRCEIGLAIEDCPRSDCPTSFNKKNLKCLQNAAENRVTLSAKGFSKPFIEAAQGPTATADVYIHQCLSKHLSFINEHHVHDDYVFWPDFASSHYAKETTEWLIQHNIKFISKEGNPPKVLKARPIDDFW